MKLPFSNCISRSGATRKLSTRAYTLVEVLIGIALGVIFLAAVAVTSLTFAKDFASMTNYTDMDIKSRLALAEISRAVRGATGVLAFTNGVGVRSLTIANTNLLTTNTFTWDPDDKTLVWGTGTGEGTILTGCEDFRLGFYQRTPGYNFTNIVATDSSKVKLVSMTWTCRRTIMGLKLNSETIQEARIVIRN